MIILTIVILGLTLYLYSIKCLDAPITNTMRFGLGACRIAFLLFLLFLLTLPQIVDIVKVTTAPTLFAALDDSLSMSFPADPPSSNEQGLSRWEETLRELQDNGLVEEWEKKGFTLRYTTFSNASNVNRESVWTSQIPESATPSYSQTDLASVVDRFTETVSPNEPAYLLLFTDGQWNQGRNPISAAATIAGMTQSVRPPIYTFGIGTARFVRDLVVDNLQAPSVARAGEQLQLRTHLIVRGVEAGANVRLRLLGETQEGDRIVEEERSIEIEDNVNEMTVPFDLPKLERGQYRFTVEAEPLEGEWIVQNNSRTRGVQIRDAKDRVLVLTSGPNWEFKYLKRVLEDQSTLSVQAYLQHENGLTRLGDREWIANQTAGATDEERVYKSLNEIQNDLSSWPSIVLHNFAFSIEQIEFVGKLREYIENGGGLVFIPGPNNDGTPPQALRDALPAPISGSFSGMARAAIVRIPTDGESPYQILSNESTGVDLPPLGSHFVARPRVDSGKILLQGLAGMNESVPLVTLHRYGLGRIIEMGGQSFWRWNLLTGKDVLTPFWLTTLYQSNPRLQQQAGEIQTDGYTYDVFEPVEISYRSGINIGEATESAVVLKVNGPSRSETVWLSPSGGAPGVFSTRYTPAEAGTYNIASLTDDASAEFRVENSAEELNDLRQNIGDLRELAQLTGGEYANKPAWNALAKRLPLEAKINREERSRFLGEKWWIAALLILALGTEWFMRWMKGLP